MPTGVKLRRVVMLGFLAVWFGVPADAQLQLVPPLLPPPLPPVLPPPIDPGAVTKLDPLLRSLLSSSLGHSPVVVRARDASSLGAVALLIRQLGGTVGRELPILDALAARMPNASLLTLATSPHIGRIAFDRLIVGSLDRTGATVGASAARLEFGYDGWGVGVAVVDSGVSTWHDDLSDGAASGTHRVRQFVDFISHGAVPYDDYGHGTHVAGIIAGNGFDSEGARSGMAPGAHLIILKVLDQQGRGRISDLIAALGYVVIHKDAFNIRVVNLSVGARVYESFNTDLLTLAVRRVVEQGIVVVAAAGNAGRTSDGHDVYGGINAPGNAPWVLTVGASSHMGTVDRGDDTIAPFSSRGPTAVDQIAKPDVVAPGVGIVSLSDPNSWLYSYRSQNLLRGTVESPPLPYLSLSGTSQATPVVSGTVALMLQANPSLTPNAVKAIIEYTSQVNGSYDWLTQGAGFLNTRGAIDLARSIAQPSATLPDAAEWGRHIIWGNHRVHGGVLTADASAWSTSIVWGSAGTEDGQPLTWGVICADDANCAGNWDPWNTPGWTAWGTTCSDGECTTAASGPEDSDNVVWGSSCGGADCSDTWSTSLDDDTVVWGSTLDGDDTVVWGSTLDSDDTVVWGSTLDNDDTVVWGNTCNDTSCEPD